MSSASLSGSLRSKSLTDLLRWLDSGKKTGTLQIYGVHYAKKIVTRDGVLIASSSTDPNDHLGHFLLRQGHITEADLEKALSTQQRTSAMLGKILVDSGVIQGRDLRAALIQKAEETIFGLFLWEDGRFEFRDEDVPDKIAVPLSLRISDVLQKGLAWADELQRIRAIFVSSRSIVSRTSKALPENFEAEGSLPRRVLDLVDGRHSIADIALEVHASDFTVGKTLKLLLEQGFIAVRRREPVKKAARPRAPLSSLLDEARSLMRVGEAQAAIQILMEAREAAPEDASIRSLLEEARAACVQEAYRDGIKPEAVPQLRKSMESLVSESLTPEEMFLLSRIDGTWDIRSILSVCPFPESDALIYLKKLKERGILGIQVTA